MSNKTLIYGVAAALGVGGGVALFMMLGKGPSTEGSSTSNAPVEVPTEAPEAEGQLQQSQRKTERPDNEPRSDQLELKKQLEEGFGFHTRQASPAWNAVAYELSGAGLDVDAAKAKELASALGAEMRNPDADAAAFIERERALVAELRSGPAGEVVEGQLVRIEEHIAAFEAPPEDGE